MPSRCDRRAFLAGLGSLVPALALADEDKIPDIIERLRQETANAPLEMKFTGTTAEECRQWQGKFGDKLRSLLVPHAPPRDWKTIVRSTADLDDHRREELLLVADGFPPLPVYLLLPRPKREKKVAGMLALHGHGSYGHHPVAGRDDLPGVAKAIAGAHYDYGRQLVRKGYAVACPCFTPFGERLGNRERFGNADPCGDTFLRMLSLGKVLLAENLRDALWAFELLARRPEVDPDHMGCAGLSYGGRMTTFTSALEPRIKACVISGALNVMQERLGNPYSCGAQVVPGMLKYGDIPEVISLIAPRYCVLEVGSKDGLIKEKWAEEALTRIRRAYKAFAALDHLQVDRFEGGHRWNGAVAFPLLEKVLG
ncbi:MAG: hypothetical protein AB7K24_01695 [Gemmataceae bacterium]